MACYVDEAEVWKCTKHPSKRRRTGICPRCLRERLVTLCPDCANARPCSCCPPPVDSVSSTTSSSFSLFSFSRGGSRRDFTISSAATGEPGRLSNHLEIDPALRRSRSLAIPFLRSRSRYVGGESELVVDNNKPVPKVSRSKIHFWSVFTLHKSKKCDVHADGIDDESNKSDDLASADDYSRMMRSRSVAVGAVDGFGTAASKRKGWYFPSPIKAFRQTKTSKAVTVS
ncbi:uncharacterized protein LOC112521529 [Cynara cardunculus var. scolymus]|uniref:Uncharacterized protein family UPF0503 n=1 Tax=Cynara cardunculus var. scolymus TaxID=59895 RepID=A0A103XGD3_CYNCS|nr:uncharacterized protein LOC112521529 [Cynara cardunculus var. scolymus]KVH90228.1 Uncharacterized protein family UPF0503 [Cynara cardunculus var. scolymus]